jgi:E3 ubiquitin-protein ligase BRE1
VREREREKEKERGQIICICRCQEEVSVLKRKLDKYKSREWMASSDEVLLEEIKTYKVRTLFLSPPFPLSSHNKIIIHFLHPPPPQAKLNCPCCSTRKKDTVLTKCFHVFCSECIRSRYDSRLRKCPKCGAAFGANDFHKIYLS